ncbi:MAG: DEAD/DEAH box helicase [Pirellulales bacterium]
MKLLRSTDGGFLWGGREPRVEVLAKEAGLTLSTAASRERGFNVYTTGIAEAVLHLWEHADPAARAALSSLRGQWELSNALEAPDGYAVPAPEFCQLLPFQRAGVYYAENRTNVLFGDAPGLGKTIQAIALANKRGCKRVLAVVPANVRAQWVRQIKIWSTIPRVLAYPVFKTSDGVHPNAHWVVVSYEVARDGLWDVLRSYNWDMVIIDEAHYLKTPDSNRTRALFGASAQSRCRYAGSSGIVGKAEQVVALTGTPLPNRPRECFTLANALAPDSIDWMNLATFKDRFNPGGRNPETGATWEFAGRLPELNARLRCNFMVRRLKEQVLKDLPAKMYEIVPADVTVKVAMALQAERMLDFDEETMLARSGGRIDGAISTVRREMGEALAPAALDHCRLLLDGGVEKLVVFAHHHSVLDQLEKGLAAYGVVRVDGSTTARGKAVAIERFRHDPRLGVFLGQLTSVGTGTDGLQDVATHCFFAEASWVFGENEQGVDRLHRMGQQGSVLAQFLVAPGSISERILGRAIAKGKNVSKVLDLDPSNVGK